MGISRDSRHKRAATGAKRSQVSPFSISRRFFSRSLLTMLCLQLLPYVITSPSRSYTIQSPSTSGALEGPLGRFLGRPVLLFSRRAGSLPQEPTPCVLSLFNAHRNGTFLTTAYREEESLRGRSPACEHSYWCQAHPHRPHPRWQPQVPCAPSRLGQLRLGL
jgi:hypothetical protein